MNCIGIRVKPSEIYFSVINIDDNDNVEIETIDKIKVPVSLDVPDQLSYIRTTLFSIVNEYNITNAGIRRMEDNSPSKKLEPIIRRAYFEGVIQELISNCIIENYFSGKISKLGSLLGYKSNEIKECIDGTTNLFRVDEWDTYNLEERESILCAFASSQI